MPDEPVAPSWALSPRAGCLPRRRRGFSTLLDGSTGPGLAVAAAGCLHVLRFAARPRPTRVRIQVLDTGRPVVNLRVPSSLGRAALERVPDSPTPPPIGSGRRSRPASPGRSSTSTRATTASGSPSSSRSSRALPIQLVAWTLSRPEASCLAVRCGHHSTHQPAFTGDPDADRLVAADRLALLIGSALDQQATVKEAFLGPRIQAPARPPRCSEMAAMPPALSRRFLGTARRSIASRVRWPARSSRCSPHRIGLRQ